MCVTRFNKLEYLICFRFRTSIKITLKLYVKNALITYFSTLTSIDVFTNVRYAVRVFNSKFNEEADSGAYFGTQLLQNNENSTTRDIVYKFYYILENKVKDGGL